MKNLGEMMKQVQAMQSRMADMQAKMEQTTVTGQSGGGMVKVTLNGKGAMTAVTIDPSLFKPEDREIVEDLIVAAHSDAKNKVETMMADEMKSVTGGLPLPPGLKLPF
ncbi:MAG TPA: YbaB/EbfC family nucleoid-associated protein [Aestuariivirga sp.]|nr:YbaB/EbfC family nucleoid-associated protein [Alphaproteobacteria bacterium]HRX34765.1 YbaB/EbfC family nucleoid-associated protein [Aestuariivirga sp.]